MNRIVVIGSSNADLVVNTDRAPGGGETVLGNEFTVNHGGKGANQAIAALRIGGSVSFVSKVGNDIFGSQMRRHFEEEGMDVSYVFTDMSAASGVALITVDSRAENRIVVVPGANNNLSKEDIDKARLVVEQSEIIVLQLEIPMVSVRYAVRLATSLGKKMIVNPAPACPLSEELLRDLYLITPNETEAGILTGIPVVDKDSAQKAATALLQQGVQNVVITLGAKGALVHNSKMSMFIPAYQVKAIDTTAAGDVFNGALAVALSEGRTLPDAASFACAASAISVTRSGAQNSIPFRNELDDFININHNKG
ncbi:MAG: ribokinase [Bacteroides sp.]|nr:ribokinase [Bacteroides sp.]